MADEAAAVAAAVVVAPHIEKIRYGLHELTSEEVIQRINECVSCNKQIELTMYFLGRFDATVNMQDAIIRNSSHIKEIYFMNNCRGKEEHDSNRLVC